ncbi:hypothetical protein [Paenibacillus spongiae]|uniref:Uncharacterized protein n=1 Tax=Paenibacillus spongiae TaxID=2909671 RepID=A0ABY5S4Y7_9BACL|nr:hypothetical protein [Paenibacillus spongiae]UVI28724.1 hypothetical protein L1F29_25280 [Paenibacillus spongiae]
MFQALIGMETVLAVIILFFSLQAGYSSGALAYRKTIVSMRSTARMNLILIALIGSLAACELLLMIYSSSNGWLSIRNELLLFALFIALPYAAVLRFTVPRLIKLSRVEEVSLLRQASRVKRRAAASAWLVVPVQALTVGTMMYTYKMLNPMQHQVYNELSILGLLYMAVIALLGFRQTVKRRRIHRDDGISAIHRMKRAGLIMATIVLLPFGLTYTVIEAQNSRIGNDSVQMDEQIITNSDIPGQMDVKPPTPVLTEQSGAPLQLELQVNRSSLGR